MQSPAFQARGSCLLRAVCDHVPKKALTFIAWRVRKSSLRNGYLSAPDAPVKPTSYGCAAAPKDPRFRAYLATSTPNGIQW